MIQPLLSEPVGGIAARDFRTAAVFEQFGIDFCCGGRRSLADACQEANADPREVVRALDALSAPPSSDDDVTRWPVEQLIDHIVSKHHSYVRSALPIVTRHLAKITAVHGQRHPELELVSRQFENVRAELEQHMLKEEFVLFPYVRDLAAKNADIGSSGSPFGTVEHPIRMMEREHRDAADGLQSIRELTRDYASPSDGCSTYAVCMSELEKFERDLHRHVHLENNVLFPAAVELEAAAAGACCVRRRP